MVPATAVLTRKANECDEDGPAVVTPDDYRVGGKEQRDGDEG